MPEVPLDDADGAKIAGFEAGESLVELLEAERPETPIGRFVAKRGPGIHHICFAVDDLDAALARCRAAGVRLIDETPRIGAEGKRIAFLHPASTGGVLIELTTGTIVRQTNFWAIPGPRSRWYIERADVEPVMDLCKQG